MPDDDYEKVTIGNSQYIEELESALIDVLDGSQEWWSIQETTGLSDERCKEISELFYKVLTAYKKRHRI